VLVDDNVWSSLPDVDNNSFHHQSRHNTNAYQFPSSIMSQY
jgi:hypothetical protein